ncbi:condensation domain-containing protein [Streptomyces sp. NBC_01483]|uniref:condensation domain-containing protein n=1 Tax=Streptomyces sp. NBC_01483 TaxID=2903883 RepID=UPI002E380D42|nr:condensation domain-containing protein [Streptomyces sp. NBC_01483]
MTASHSSREAISVVIDPGPAPDTAPWDLELRGPLDPAALEHVLDELTAEDPGRPVRGYRLVRHGPDHHTLRFTPTQGAPDASLMGRISDLLTEPPVTDRPLTPAQYAVLTHGGEHRYEAVFIEPAGPLDGAAVREALRVVVAAHPQLRSRLDTAGGRLTGQDGEGDADGTGNGAVGGQDPLVEGEFTDEADFAAAVASTGRTLDAHLGIQLRALLARDRRPAGPCADRLALVVHELAVDAASWQTLLDDLTAALSAAAAGAPVRPRRAPDGLADWVTGLRELACDPAEVRHWTSVADRRFRTVIGPRRTARVTRPGDPADTAPADARDTEPGTVRHTGFALDEDVTERITHGLAQRLALTAGQLLTGVFALALARWQGVDEVSLDVRSDPRTGHHRLRRHVGRLTDPYPVHLTLDSGLDPLGQLAAAAGPLAASAGQAAGGAGFGACREWNPDPLLRDALRELAPARASLILPGPDELLPGPARPLPGGARSRPPHRVEARLQVVGGRLHLGLDWVPDHAEGITDTSVAALGELLRDLLVDSAEASTAPIPSAFRATPQQSALFTGGDAQPGTGRHVEQLIWVWHGPLDRERFAAAWQSVFDCEAVLRTAFTGGPEPQLMVHSRVTPEITRRIHRGDDWSPFLERDRLRGFDLRCPGALRLTLLETERPRPAGTAAPTRIVLTYHRALLDTWSAHILLREFYRAYLAGGPLPGGERRPDLRDYTAWLAAQDLEPAREFYARSAPPDAAASRPGRPAGATGLIGVGRARLRLDPAETSHLARWAGTWGTAESSVLQAVWAMLIYRASGATGPATVSFAVTVPGRGIPFDGVARMPGPLRNPLPMSVEVDPADTVLSLLRRLRDRALDMAAYEWVPGDRIRPQGRRGPGADPADTVIVFEDPPHPVEGLESELAAHGIHAEFSGTVPARSVLPIGLLAHHDDAGALVCTAVHDRALLDEEAAAELLVQSALLLRELPSEADEFTTVAEVLKLLEGRAVPRMAETSGAGRDNPLVTLRAAGQGQERAGTICLIPPPGAPATCYDLLTHTYAGPEEVLVLAADADGAQHALAAHGTGRLLLLGGFSGAGALVCDLARRIAADGGRAPRVVVAGGSADKRERARELARALQEAAAPDA